MIEEAELKRIYTLWRDRQGQWASLHSRNSIVSRIYSNQLQIPLPSMQRAEQPSVPNLLAQGIDQLGGRISSVIPQPSFVSVKPGQRRADRDALNSSMAIQGWWELDRLALSMKVRSRQLVGHAMSPVVMEWKQKEHRPHWDVRESITCYPSPDLRPGQVVPSNVFFYYQRTVGTLADMGYGAQLYKLLPQMNQRREFMVDLLEFHDEHCSLLIATSSYQSTGYVDFQAPGACGVVLEYTEHGLGCTPVTVPVRMALDTVSGQFDNMVGMYLRQAKLMALEEIAVEKGVFPETWLVSAPGMTAKVVDGQIHDGRTGFVNIVKDGDIKELQSTPGYMTPSIIDRLERAQRVSAGIPSELGGESGTNIRTAKRGSSVLSSAIDFPIAEAQDILAYALQEENKLAIKLAKKHDGTARRTIYVGVHTARKPVTYIANETFATDEHVVNYPISGVDSNGMVVEGAQRVGMGTLSKESFMEMDPWVQDPELERDRIVAQGLNEAMLAGIQQQAANGTLAPLVVAEVATLVKQDKLELAEALTQVAEKASQVQAQQQEATTLESAVADGTMQGLAGIQPPEQTMPGMANLSDLMATTRRPAMAIDPNRVGV